MKILVTGGAGFIGSHLVDKLIEQGHKVTVIDNLSTGNKKNLHPKARFYMLDICSSKTEDIFKKEKPEIIFHFAAQTDIRKSIEDPIEDAKINILGSLNLLENCKKYKLKKFIFASSVGVYGEPKMLPIKENHSINPLAPYPIGKLTIEKYLYHYQTLGISFVSLRYSNIYGPRQISEGEGGVVAIFIDKVLKEKRPIIYGNGKQVRDFLHVDDAVAAAILGIKSSSGSVYNIGTNKETTIGNLFKLISKILDKDIKPIYKPFRQGEIIRSRVSYLKAKKDLKWQPKYNLKKGLQETIKYFYQS